MLIRLCPVILFVFFLRDALCVCDILSGEQREREDTKRRTVRFMTDRGASQKLMSMALLWHAPI